ncbi:HNH endonuclease [Rhodococcus sp. A5(2022)]|uniref:HNH endonuclease n=1 Tax=Rhodococcus sp. A5(2022) TaxID=3003588 RepID=UPI0022A84AED|nr:HNH endonuclease [Rhodococcus sp. A5(2022)]MCZ1070809.1 HNH endonuclease [Rhodococcus sp. A5(2022)]
MSRTGHSRYRRNRNRIQRTSDTCHLCGEWINPELTYPHPMSFSADHVDPVGNGGSNNGELKAAHLRCNLRRGKRAGLPGADTRHARRW